MPTPTSVRRRKSTTEILSENRGRVKQGREVKVSKLKPGMIILGNNGKQAEIESVTKLGEVFICYRLKLRRTGLGDGLTFPAHAKVQVMK